MAGRSLTATPNGIQQITRALTERGWSREDLAKDCDCSRQPAIKFCSGKPVSNKLFVSFCNALNLGWEDIAGLKSTSVPAETQGPETDIDALVQTIRVQVHDDTQTRCGTMRVLDMEQPIGLGDIYTSVNILAKLSRNQQPPRDEWLKCDPENFDRFLLGQVRQPRIPGLQAVEEHRQLMILGKPGAGKTTFLKRLAILCNQGEFQPQRVPIFVTLKEYAETKGKPKLQTYIQTQWHDHEVRAGDALSAILSSGRALVLLDGLDEVQEADHDRVLQDIKTFAHQFRNCQCVITCRIAAQEYTFEQFTQVEVADFDKEQIAEFVIKWFTIKHDPVKAEVFIKELNDENNKPIYELAVTPILLTLLCLIFEETSEFPRNRSDLYRQGTDWLLKRWDNRRGIKRDLAYKKLPILRKKELLSQLAFETFERGNYFFKQATVEQHIVRYIRNLPGANDDEEAMQLEGEAVLKSIESQHGLLIERARSIYSFSHLTFQEYFTAQHIISPTATLNQVLHNLATHITEKRYREIFLLTADMLPEADGLLLLMKQHIDKLMVDAAITDSKPQAILAWAQQKAASVNTSYKPAVIRGFYYSLSFDIAFNIAINAERAFDLNLDPNLDPNLDLNLDFDLARACIFPSALDLDLARARTLAIAFALTRAEQSPASENKLKLKIQVLKAELPDQNYRKSFKQWWLTHGKTWAERLRAVMIKHRNIGHDWQFSQAQKERLSQYYEANKLLVDCLNSDCYVTKATRQYIEDTLLLPLSEIEKYPVPDAIANI